jgi:hypothetical protein
LNDLQLERDALIEPWFTLPVDGTDMERFNLKNIYWLGFHFSRLESLDGQRLLDFYADVKNQEFGQTLLTGAFVFSSGFGQGQNAVFSTGTKQAAKEVFRLIEQARDHCDRTSVKDAQRHVDSIKSALKTFEARFAGDCESLNVFSIPQVQAYDVRTLIEEGERLLPEPVIKKLLQRPKPLADTREAAKCLAYKLWTASGFHVARTTEAVLQDYYCHVTKGDLPKVGGQRTWVKLTEHLLGGPLNKTTNTRPNPPIGNIEILESVDYVGRAYRNPLIHPEHVLTETDGPSLLEACVGAMTKLLAGLP